MEARVAVDLGANDAHVSVEARRCIENAVESEGGELTGLTSANALFWLSLDPHGLQALLDSNPQIEWVQLPWAGVDGFADAGVFERPIKFSCAKSCYGQQTGELAFMLTLISLRNVVRLARIKQWLQLEPQSLVGKRITILGAGSIATTLVGFFTPAQSHVTVLRKRPEPVDGVQRTLSITDLHDVLPNTDVLILALSLTPETNGIIGTKELALLPQHAVLVNVARGKHVDTAALTKALASGEIAAAGLDVTDPEPLPDDHALWSFDNVYISSHMFAAEDIEIMLTQRVRENVRRFIDGRPLVGTVDPVAGY